MYMGKFSFLLKKMQMNQCDYGWHMRLGNESFFKNGNTASETDNEETKRYPTRRICLENRFCSPHLRKFIKKEGNKLNKTNSSKL